MDYRNNGPQPAAAGPVAPPPHQPVAGRPHNSNRGDRWNRLGVVAAAAAVVVLLIGLIALVYDTNNHQTDEAKYVFTNKLQAVFLNTGQVYFGNIKQLNGNYLVLTNIYYLQTTNSSGSSASSSTSNSASNVTLVKLGCELHQPYDQMVINRSQVTFWENLQSTGQVAKAVATFQQQNPNGQKCADQSTSSGNTSSSVQSAPSSTSKP